MMKLRTSACVAALALAATICLPAAAQTRREPVRRMIVFGDSLSDGGYYRNLVPGASRFTTNPDFVSPELVGQSLGLQLNSFYGLGGTNYATGGARITAANSLSIPIATQINNYLAAGGTFSGDDLVYIQGGGNDFFFFQATGSNNNAILTTAATELAQQVVRVQGAGAERIVTMSVQTGGMAGLQLFNQTYEAALRSAGVNALFVDVDQLYNEILANPGSFGITNITSTACLGSSLTCTPATYREPNANRTYLLADSVHPSGISQIIQAQAITSLVRAPEQIGQLSYSAQSIGRSHREMAEGPMRGSAGGDTAGVRLFGNVGYHQFTNDGSDQRVPLEERSLNLQVGADIGLGDTAGVGLAGSYSDGEGDFEGGFGGYDVRAWSATGYARAGFGPLRVGASATYGSLTYDNVSRNVQLGPVLRTHSGSTDGTYMAASGSLSFLGVNQGGVQIGPEAGITYERVEIEGYSENSTLSTSATFGDQELDSLTGRIGLVAVASPLAAVRVSGRVSYEHDFNDDDRRFTITPTGAPISYTSNLSRADDDYGSYALAVEAGITSGLAVRAGIRGYVGRTEYESFTSYAGVSLNF